MALQQTENSNILMFSYTSYGLFIVNDTQKNERTSHANSKDLEVTTLSVILMTLWGGSK